MSSIAEAAARQGGDLRGLPYDRDYLDLSTCINRYGPPPEVGRVLRELDPGLLKSHPYDAERMFVAAYARYFGVEEDDLVAGRGITEFIRLLSVLLPPEQVAVLTPDYTDSIRFFYNHLPTSSIVDTVGDRLDRIADGMRRYRYVVMSNPNNPLGLHVPPGELGEVCRAFPDSILIVDEAYIDFTSGGPSWSMVWTGVPNVIVLASPNKPFGIAGTRTGVLWTRDPALRAEVAKRRLNWPLSYLDALVASAALRSVDWIASSRTRLLSAAASTESLLQRRFPTVVTGVPVHYRFVATDDAARYHSELVSSGVVVRMFSGTERGRVPGLRITTPLADEVPVLASALSL